MAVHLAVLVYAKDVIILVPVVVQVLAQVLVQVLVQVVVKDAEVVAVVVVALVVDQDALVVAGVAEDNVVVPVVAGRGYNLC